VKLMKLRYAGNCGTCGTQVGQGVDAWFDPEAEKGKKVTCTSCRPVDGELTGQLGIDTAAPAKEPPAAPKRSARTDLEKGTEPEQRIADVFAANGYRVETNVTRHGRSGRSHEIDVIATKTDELLTLSVAIECKAWNNPIDTDVVAKFHDAHLDLGIGHGLIVALAGARPRAMDMAKERGITVWGSDEMQPHLGKAQLVGLQNRPMIEEVGFPRLLAGDVAQALVEKETSGRFGIGKEEVTWTGDAWLPVAVVQMTLMQVGSLRRKTAASQMWGVYDLVGGTFVTGLDADPERTPVRLDADQIRPALKPTDPAKTLDKIVASYRKVTSDDAKAKYRGQMANLGVPDFQVPNTGTSTPFLYPVRLAIARKGATERVVAIDAFRSRPDPDLGHELTKAIVNVRESLNIPSA
jgi:Restriction endonuclease